MIIVCGVEYCGYGYHGWQRQEAGLPTVQGIVEQAISRVADHLVTVVASGRTDTGVHATQQVIHFETQSQRSPDNWLMGANRYLPPNIRIVWLHPVAENFHARFSAQFRRYCYLIHLGRVKSALFHHQVTMSHRELAPELMSQGAECLVGSHDFSAFRAAQCQAKHPNRTIHFINIKTSPKMIMIDIQADGFLHHMVRNIAGVLLCIAAKDQPPEWCQQVLDNRQRCLAGVTAPSNGLYFIHAGYPAEFDCPTEPRWPLLAMP